MNGYMLVGGSKNHIKSLGGSSFIAGDLFNKSINTFLNLYISSSQTPSGLHSLGKDVKEYFETILHYFTLLWMKLIVLRIQIKNIP